MNTEKLTVFLITYRSHLAQVVDKYPDEYPWAKSTPVETVFQRMAAAIGKGSYSKEGRAFVLTCKALGIKHTYKAIDAYLER